MASRSCEPKRFAAVIADVAARVGPGSVSNSGVPLANFARNLAPLTGRFVIDRTGLTGPWDLDLKWTPDQVAADRPASALTDGTSLFAAIQEQLGLKLEAQRAPVDAIVIESADRPIGRSRIRRPRRRRTSRPTTEPRP